MPMPMNGNSVWHQGTTQTISVTNASAAVTNPFGSQTYAVRISVGLNAGVTGLHYRVGDGTPTAVIGDPALPITWVEYVLCNPGQKVAAITDAGTCTMHVTELS